MEKNEGLEISVLIRVDNNKIEVFNALKPEKKQEIISRIKSIWIEKGFFCGIGSELTMPSSVDCSREFMICDDSLWTADMFKGILKTTEGNIRETDKLITQILSKD